MRRALKNRSTDVDVVKLFPATLCPVAECKDKTATMEIKNPSPHARRGNVVQSVAPCVGGREGRAACAVGAVIRCVLEMMKGMRCMLFCMPEALEGELCLLEVLEVLEAMRRVLLCMLDAVGVSSICSRCRR